MCVCSQGDNQRQPENDCIANHVENKNFDCDWFFDHDINVHLIGVLLLYSNICTLISTDLTALSLRSVCTYDLGQDSPIQTCSVNKS